MAAASARLLGMPRANDEAKAEGMIGQHRAKVGERDPRLDRDLTVSTPSSSSMSY